MEMYGAGEGAMTGISPTTVLLARLL